jgi:hypothetical protein
MKCAPRLLSWLLLAKVWLTGILLVILSLLGVEEVQAAGAIRVASFTSPRSQFPLLDPDGQAVSGSSGTSHLVGALQDDSKFGEQGTVKCEVDLLTPVTDVTTGSLVASGSRQADIFWAGVSSQALSSVEVNELKSFISAGGVLYLSGGPQSGEGIGYHNLLSSLGLADRFASSADFTSFEGESTDPPDDNDVTDGPFGKVGPILHGAFRPILLADLIALATGFDEIGFPTLSVDTPVASLDAGNVILAEGEMGSGYLSLTGSPIHFDYYLNTDDDNRTYLLNLFAKACAVGKQLDVDILKQTDSRWGSLEYDHGDDQTLGCGSTISACGCALTSVAMILNYHGATKDPDGNDTTPEMVNKYFNRDSKETVCGRLPNGDPIVGRSSLGYYCGNVKWTTADLYSAAANKLWNTQKITHLGKPEDKLYSFDVVKSDIEIDNPAVLAVPGHFVVATGVQGNTLSINDPGYSRTTLSHSAYNNNAQGVRRYEKTASDFSELSVAISAPDQVIITSPNGQRTGFDPEINQVFEEISNAMYYFEQSYNDVSGINLPRSADSGVYWAIVTNPEPGDYTVEVTTIEPNLPYGFTVYSSDKDANAHLNQELRRS